jgi:hypothetical protein
LYTPLQDLLVHAPVPEPARLRKGVEVGVGLVDDHRAGGAQRRHVVTERVGSGDRLLGEETKRRTGRAVGGVKGTRDPQRLSELLEIVLISERRILVERVTTPNRNGSRTSRSSRRTSLTRNRGEVMPLLRS